MEKKDTKNMRLIIIRPWKRQAWPVYFFLSLLIENRQVTFTDRSSNDTGGKLAHTAIILVPFVAFLVFIFSFLFFLSNVFTIRDVKPPVLIARDGGRC